MFLGLDIDNSLLYDWRENHFSIQFDQSWYQKMNDLPFSEENQMLLKGQQVFSVVNALLPKLSVLPPIPKDTQAYYLLQENIKRERNYLFRWICGDPSMTKEKYQEFRLDPEFTIKDLKIDQMRKAEAMNNLKILLRTREKTGDIREGVQEIIAEVIGGKRTINDVKDELIIHQRELLSYLPNQKDINIDISLASIGMAMSIAGWLVNFLPMTYAGSTLAAIDVVKGAYEVWQARAEKYEISSLRHKYPLAFLIRDIDKELLSKSYKN
jgi:hypothetical protein